MRVERFLVFCCFALFCVLLFGREVSAVNVPISRADRFGFVNDQNICNASPQCELREEDYALAEEGGFGWMRLWIYWDRVNPAPGVYVWGQVDAEVARAKRHNIKIYWHVAWAPRWATGGVPAYEHFACMVRLPNGRNDFAESISYCAHPPQTPELDALRDFIEALIGRYPEDIKYMGCWNEPSDKIFWPAGDIVRDMMQPCYDFIKAVNSAIQVVGPEEISPRGLKRILAREAALGRPIFDILSFHLFYGNGNPIYPVGALRSFSHFLSVAGTYRTIQYPDGRKVKRPLWMTASGTASDNSSPASLELQADALEYLFRPVCSHRDVSKCFVYKLRGSCKPSTSDNGITFCNGTPKPSWCRLRNIIIDEALEEPIPAEWCPVD